ncbi:Gamma-aminobutyric acid type B receptor subunit 1 [Holothuria leucospilota]|uniref:Gamma-aminobutyric acid type B receptor subunit 2 n=1 Tax=Holothuria leucospilota TaxID=206669 RepID=A0A9Q1HH71_HOLLE|nr:Gamma-aminobutyric acid type B receptor subunit 1 [Holothuria leucospilota]
MRFWMTFLWILMVHLGNKAFAYDANGTLSPFTESSPPPQTQPSPIPTSTKWFTDGYQWTTERPSPSSSDDILLFLGGLFSLSGGWDGSGVFVGADLALKHVNENPNMLPGYKLMMTLSDSQCNAGVGIQKLFQQIFHNPPKVMIIGPACSTAAQAVASTAHFWNLISMSPTASSPALSSRSKYPKFFRIIPSDTLLNPPRVSLMKLYNWTRIATIHQNHELFSLSIDDLLTRLKENNITVISSESFDEDPSNQVENLKKQDAKIIVANMYAPSLRKVMCEAYKQGLYGEGYVWLVVGWYNADWHLQDNGILDCSLEEMKEVVESSMYISTQARLLGDEDVMTIAGVTIRQYLTLLNEHFNELQEQFGYTLIGQAHYGYDSIWSVAMALNYSIEILKTKTFSDGRPRSLENFTHADDEMAEVFFSSLENVSFEGVSGPVSFSGSDRIGVINIEQFQGQCGNGWTNFGRNCYLFVASQMTWDEAANHCRDKGGYLVSILSEEENEALTEIRNEQILGGVTQWWLSLKRSSNGELSWSAGPKRNLHWTPWDQPTEEEEDSAGATDEDGSKTESCFVIDFTLDTWLPVPCETSQYSLICKQKAVFQEVVIAEDDIAKNKIEWIYDIIWPGGGDEVPLDHTPVIIFEEVEIYEGIPFIVYIICCSAAALGILLAVICLIFNIKFRNQRFIKLSSPNLNSLIIIGCILIYASACMAGWDSPIVDHYIFLRLCQVRVWCFSIGFVLSFGSMFSKTWRVHKVAALKNPKRVIITDRHLFVMVGVLLLVDVVLLSAWFVVSPMRVERSDLYEMEDVENQVIRQPYILFCTSDLSIYWQGALYSYKALLLIFGVFLAWETRKVTIPALNDSKLIGVCVYNVVLLSAIGVGVNFAITTDPSVSFIFTSAIQIFCTSVTLVIIFIPKMVSVKKYPEGKAVTTMKNNTASNITLSSESDAGLKDEITQLKTQLHKLQVQSQGNHHHSGCGFWCRSIMCACGDDTLTVENGGVVESTETLGTTA